MVKNLTIMLLSVFILGCSNKNGPVVMESSSSGVDREQEEVMGNVQAAGNSIVLGRLTSKRMMDGVDQDSPCAAVECMGSFEILSFIQYGANFHGQIEEGQIVEALFDFTLSDTKNAFPELNEPLPGLNVDDYFEAELFEDVDDGSLTIRLYELKK